MKRATGTEGSDLQSLAPARPESHLRRSLCSRTHHAFCESSTYLGAWREHQSRNTAPISHGVSSSEISTALLLFRTAPQTWPPRPAHGTDCSDRGNEAPYPFVERLSGTLRREYFDRVFFWNAVDLERKFNEFKTYFNGHRVHRAIDGVTPSQRAGTPSRAFAALDQYAWQQHCRGLSHSDCGIIGVSPLTGQRDERNGEKRPCPERAIHSNIRIEFVSTCRLRPAACELTIVLPHAI